MTRPGRQLRCRAEPCLLDHELGSDRGVIGQTLIVNGRAFTIVGIAPKGFTGTTLGSTPKVFVPISMRAEVSPGWRGSRGPAQLLDLPVRAAQAAHFPGPGARRNQPGVYPDSQ
jgi:hypothetical protein